MTEEFIFSSQLQILGAFVILIVIAVLIIHTKERNVVISSDAANTSKLNISGIDGKLGVIIPLFTNYSDSGDWETVIDAKTAHPDVPIIAIVNPSSGSGLSKDPRIAEGVRKLQNASVKVIGYVPTSYSWRNRDDVVAEVKRYNKWYGVDGIFFDEVSHWYGRESYYTDLVGYVKSKSPGSVVVGNSGTDEAMSTYTDIFDILIIYESPKLPVASKLDSWYNKSREKLAVLAFNVDFLVEGDLKGIDKNVNWLFVTQGNMPNPWKELPTYFDDFVTMVENVRNNEN